MVLQGDYESPLASSSFLPTPVVSFASNGTWSYVIDLLLIVLAGVVIGLLIGGCRYRYCTAKESVGQKEYELLNVARGDDDEDDDDDKNKHNGQYEQVSTSISL